MHQVPRKSRLLAAIQWTLIASGAASVADGGAVLAADGAGKEADSAQEKSRAESIQGLEQIIVTARKRSEALLDVPVAIVAVSKAALQNNVANDLSKIAELAPQVSIGRVSTGTGAVMTIRGISSSPFNSGLDQSVALSIDGVSLSRGRIAQSAQFDLQQVEVLQGPQALFFGKNSPAGVISIVSADPTDSFDAYATAGYEFEAEEKYVESAISGPITETLKARAAVRYSDMNGWTKNVAPARDNPFQPSVPLPGALQGNMDPMSDDLAGRLTLLWEPSDTFSAKLKVTMDRQRLNSNAAFSEGFCTGGTTTVPATLGVPQPNNDCSANMRKAESSLPAEFAVNYPYANGGIPYQRSDIQLASLTLNKIMGDLTLTSASAYYKQRHQGAQIGDYSEFAQVYDSEHERFEMFNQELRLSSDFTGAFNFMVGAYYETSDRQWLNAPDLFNLFNPLARNYTTTVTTSDSDNVSYSIFGQVRWKLTADLELAGGARFTRDQKDSTLVSLTNNPNSVLAPTLYPQNVPIDARYRDDNVSPEVTLTWKLARDQTLYAAYKTGYKAGGISNASLLASTSTPDNLLFGPEKAKGFEAGYRAEDLFDRPLSLSLTAYRYAYDGLQVTALDVTSFTYSIRNAARARTTGVTASLRWLATDRLSFNGDLGYNRARYLEFPNSQCYVGQTAAQGCVAGAQDLKGEPLNRAPEWNYTLGGDYRMDLAQGWSADLSVGGTYTSSYETQSDYAPGGYQSSFWRLNAALHLASPGDKYRFSLIGRNLTNSYYRLATYSWTLGNPDQYQGYFNRPREVALQASYNF